MAKKELKFVQCKKDNKEHSDVLLEMMIPYFDEVYTDCENANELEVPPPEHTAKFSKAMINGQGAHDRHLEICYETNDIPIGFYHAKVGHDDRPGGFILEFYILPDYRRKGYGKIMFHRIETLFAIHGVKQMYLRSKSFTGMPFWESLGFKNVDIKTRFYEKELEKLELFTTK